MALVTVGLSFYNARKTIALAVKSVFAQDIADWHLLLIDDGSTDGSLDIVRGLTDPRVTILSDGRQLGLSKRLNEIASLARSPFLARMDADDVMRSSRISRQVQELERESRVDIVASRAYVIGDDDVVCGLLRERPLPGRPAGLLANGVITHPTVMGRTGWFLNNRYDEAFARAQDKELWCRTYKAERFVKLSEPLLYYRLIGNFSLGKYRRSKSFDARVIRRYGSAFVGRARAHTLILATYAKPAVFAALSVVRSSDALFRRACEVRPASEITQAQSELAAIMGLSVEGLVSQTTPA